MPRKATDVIKTYSKMLPVELTDAELQVRGGALAHAQQELEAQEADAKEKRAELREQKKELTLNVHKLALVVAEKKEEREVQVFVRPAKRSGFVEEVRSDTKEVIDTRPISGKEAQGELLDEEANVDREDLDG